MSKPEVRQGGGVGVGVVLAAACAASGCAGPRGPLAETPVMAFVATAKPAEARSFYEGKLGFVFLEEDPYAMVFDTGGTVLRVQKIPGHAPVKFTVLGWNTPDIRATVAKLADAGVAVERFEWMKEQDATGVATFPNGDKVAWFRDPDGNTLSLAQMAKK